MHLLWRKNLRTMIVVRLRYGHNFWTPTVSLSIGAWGMAGYCTGLPRDLQHTLLYLVSWQSLWVFLFALQYRMLLVGHTRRNVTDTRSKKKIGC